MNVERCRNMLLCTTMQDCPHFCSKSNWCLLGSYPYVLQYFNQTYTIPKGFVISYLLFWSAFTWQISFRRRKIQLAAFYKKSDWWKFVFSETQKFSLQITMFSFRTLEQLLFISHFVFSQLIFLLQKSGQI